VSGLRDRDFSRILLVKPSAVGDVVHTIPIIAKLRARYPGARIDWFLTPAIAELVGRHPALSGVVLFDRRGLDGWWRSPSRAAALARLLRSLRAAKYDLVIDLHGQFRSAVFVLATGAHVRIGFDRPRASIRRLSRPLPIEAYRHGWTGARELSWLAYTHRIPIPTLDVHAVDRYLWLGPILGLDDGPPDFRFPIPADAADRVDELLRAGGINGQPVAVLFPGTQWETKHWPAARFADVARHLLATGFGVVLAGSPAEEAVCREVAAGCPMAVDLAGKTTLTESAALIARAAVCVTNDSGPMHLAAALGRPVVAVFGPTDPVWVGPYGSPETVVRAGVPCSPCYLRRLARCPYAHACMTGASAEAVNAKVDAALARSGFPPIGPADTLRRWPTVPQVLW
jgi:lipopolysaccharide heptosyltransferase I